MDVLRPVKQVAGLVEQVLLTSGSIENAATAAAAYRRRHELEEALERIDPSLLSTHQELRR